jgi:hypothetical protein
MARPQDPELARSAKTDLDPDHIETGLQGQPPPTTGGETGPIPADNQPGHHPAKEQDKPDLDAFAAKLGADPKAPAATKARKPAAGSTKPPAKTGASKTGPAKAAKPSASASRPTADPVWPESAPAGDDLGPLTDAAGFSAPQPSTDPPPEREPFMVALAMLPLRETVKRLENLEQTLSKRLMERAGRGPNR